MSKEGNKMDLPVKDTPLECARWNCQFKTKNLDKFIAHVKEHDVKFDEKMRKFTQVD